MSSEEREYRDIRFFTDPITGKPFYVQAHIDGLDGMPDDFADYDLGDIQDNVSSLNDNLGTVQSQIDNLQSQISSMVKDTGWLNIKLNSGITVYSSSETPKARLISVNGVSFLSLKGAVKGLTATGTIGTLPTNMTVYVSDAKPFVQNTTKVSNTFNFARWRVQTNGNVDLEGATQSTIDSTHWFPIGTTLML